MVGSNIMCQNVTRLPQSYLYNRANTLIGRWGNFGVTFWYNAMNLVKCTTELNMSELVGEISKLARFVNPRGFRK